MSTTITPHVEVSAETREILLHAARTAYEYALEAQYGIDATDVEQRNEKVAEIVQAHEACVELEAGSGPYSAGVIRFAAAWKIEDIESRLADDCGWTIDEVKDLVEVADTMRALLNGTDA